MQFCYTNGSEHNKYIHYSLFMDARTSDLCYVRFSRHCLDVRVIWLTWFLNVGIHFRTLEIQYCICFSRASINLEYFHWRIHCSNSIQSSAKKTNAWFDFISLISSGFLQFVLLLFCPDKGWRGGGLNLKKEHICKMSTSTYIWEAIHIWDVVRRRRFPLYINIFSLDTLSSIYI